MFALLMPISDRVHVDGGHRVDTGTQTFTFPAAVLATNTRVGDTASASACDHAAPQLSCPSPLRTLCLGLAPETLEVEVPRGRYLPFQPSYQHTFSFACGQAFRRDQFSWHSANVHGDIHAGLSGWMERRCPLAYYGCTFSQRRLSPAGGARVVHDGQLQSFGLRPCPGGPPPSLWGGSPLDRLTGLPMEILWHIAGFLDSFSLCQLSVASRGMRDVCAGLLQTRGVVELQWERRQGPPPHSAVSWHAKNKVWRFSTAFSAVPTWLFSDLPSMSDHLRKCRFNTPEPKTEPVPLPAMYYVIEHWRDDDFFGYQFMNGGNPNFIKRCSELPDNFPVTEEMVKPFLASGSSLANEMTRGNVFICDYKRMQDLPTAWTGGKPAALTAALCLLYLTPDQKLVPIAIQTTLGRYPEERFDESTPKQIIKRFQVELSRLSKAITRRNSGLQLPYNYLNPDQIENSVTV
ncbi:hypothetical protein NHX12_025760 [Muraenolepis orangiensis]|uniref:F-box domain-containing protein n=1 Tax=Muraenolepis orangiensis TaxID=630683 RepID=A0A9Q0EFA2_9TELE|nr:hypothetical protein NHX12_025760 [Muraenolepis orangiensis]